MKTFLEPLTDNELVTVALVYGMNPDGITMSTQAIAKAQGVSSDAVAKRLKSGLLKLADPSLKASLETLATLTVTDLFDEALSPA